MYQLDKCKAYMWKMNFSTSQCCLKAPPFPVCQDVEHFKMNQLRFAAGTTAGSGLTYLTCAGKQEQFRWEMFLNGCFIHRLISLDTSKSNFGGCYLWTLTYLRWVKSDMLLNRKHLLFMLLFFCSVYFDEKYCIHCEDVFHWRNLWIDFSIPETS